MVPPQARADSCHDLGAMSEFVSIRRGWFRMGSTEGQAGEQPVHRVWVDAFELAIHPVTRGDYERFLDETGYTPAKEWDNPAVGGRDLPVVGVSWHDAQAYCRCCLLYTSPSPRD